MKIVFMGTPEFAAPILEGLIDGGFTIAAVYTKPDKAKGRGQELSISVIKKLALAHNLPIHQPATLRSPEEARKLAELGPDMAVVAAYGLILPPEVLAVPVHGCLNVHPSLLPKYRGPSPVSTAIMNGDDRTGVTIMLLDEGTDTGPVLAQNEEPILPEDTTGSLTEKLALAGAHLLLETMPKWVCGEIRPVPQDPSQATYSKTLCKEDGEIDWRRDAESIVRQVRALLPWPGAFTYWKGRRLKILRASALPASGAGEPGKVAVRSERGPGLPVVTCGNGVLTMLSIQLEGKKEVSGGEFIRGQRDFAGSVLGTRT